MSRQSRPRESVFASGADYRSDQQVTCSPHLFDCVRALDDICAETYDGQVLLRDGTFDLPRMAHVLSNHRVFLLVNESTVQKYKADLAEEIEPQIFELLDRANKGMKTLERREQALRAKAEQVPSLKAVSRASTTSKLEEKRLQQLTSQRLRLEQECAALQAEVATLEEQVIHSR